VESIDEKSRKLGERSLKDIDYMLKDDTKNGNGRRTITKDSAISLGVVISMIAISIWTTNAHQTLTNFTGTLQRDIKGLNQEIQNLQGEFVSHKNRGTDGLPHPEGTIREIKEVRKEIQDSWKKTDDYLFMRDFASANGLKMIPHRRIEEMSKEGK